MSVLGLVPARGGSKGIPDKNLRELAGRPLLAYTADAARASGVIDRLVLSTDSTAIAEVGRALGLEVLDRPAALAADDTPMLDVVLHALEHDAEADLVAILQPTSPLRRGEDVRAAVELARSTGCDAVAGVVAVPLHLSPDYVMRLEGERLVPFLDEGARITRRQDARPAYVRDGTVYVVRREVAVERRSLYGDDCRPLLVDPAASLSLDTPADWAEAERRLTG
jgi:CMP-N,N'-diacetyllegionaminic acid synthase